MSKRFSRLDYALELAKLSKADTATFKTDSPLDKYNQYASKEFKPSYERAAESLPEELLVRAINPFGAKTAATGTLNVVVSQRAIVSAAGKAASEKANLFTPLKGIRRVYSYEPAKAIIRVYKKTTTTDTSSSTKPKSQITGLAYNKANVDTYTIPYGRAADTDYEQPIRDAITTATVAVAADGERIKITFKSEQL